MEKTEKIRKGVKLIADGVNVYGYVTEKELKHVFSETHSVLLNWIAYAAMEAISERSECDQYQLYGD